MKTCKRCGESRRFSDFTKKSNAKDGLQSNCRDCQRLTVREHYAGNREYYIVKAKRNSERYLAEIREFLLGYFREHSCVDCSEKDIRCLQFDHVRGTKSENIGDMVKRGKPIAEVKKEIQKCDVRCANCHMKRTSIQFGWWTSKVDLPL